MPDFDDLTQTRQPEQLDPFAVRDAIQEGLRLLRKCAPDLGTRYLGDLVEQAPSTIANQLAGTDPNKQPSFALGIALAFSHEPFKRALRALLSDAPALDPEEGIVEIERDLLPNLGAHDAKKLRGILKRVKRGGR